MSSTFPPHSPLTSFSLFPTLPTELQQHIWYILACSEAQQRGVRNQRIAPDAQSLKRPASGPVQLQIINQPHYLPKFLQVCTNSREVSQRIYTHWPRYNGGYIYVNKARDIFHFAGTELRMFWFLDAAIAHNSSGTIESDEVALTHFKEQIQGVRHFAFDYWTWKNFLLSHNVKDSQFFSSTFCYMTTMTIALPVWSSGPPGPVWMAYTRAVHNGRVSDRRYRYITREYMMNVASLKRFADDLDPLFKMVRESYPNLRAPTLKVAIRVEEREYRELDDEDRFTSVMYSAPELEFI